MEPYSLYSAINADGTLSGGMKSRFRKTQALIHQGVTVTNGYLYIIGGWDGEHNTTAVSSAHILPDGSLGQWNDEPPACGTEQTCGNSLR